MRKRTNDYREIDLGDERNISATAAPVDSFVRPPPVQGANLDLVRALGGFNDSLRDFGISQANANVVAGRKVKEEKADDDEVNRGIAQYRQIADPEARRTFLRENATLNQKYKEHGLQALGGQDAAVEMDREYEQRKANTPPEQWNATSVQAELYQKFYGQLPDHAAARAGFNRIAGQLGQRNADKADGERLKREEQDRDTGFMQTVRNSFDEINKTHEGKPPAERAELIRKSVIEKMDLLRNTRGLTRERAMGLIGGFLDTVVQQPGNEDVVREMLDGIDHNKTTLRTMLGGKATKLEEAAKAATLTASEKSQATQMADIYGRFANGDDTPQDNQWLDGRLKEGNETPSRVVGLREASERSKNERVAAQQKDFKANAENRFLTENAPTLSALAQSGQLYKVQGDETLTRGDQTVQIKRDAMREAGMKAAEQEIMTRGASNRMSPDEIWQRRLELYEKNGQDHPIAADIANQMQRVGTGVTGDTVPQFMIDNWDMVSQMRKSSPKMFNRLFPGKSKEFFDTLDIATEYAKGPDGKIDFVRALRESQWVQANGDRMPSVAPKDMQTRVKQVIDRMGRDDPDAWFFTANRATDGNSGLTPEMQADVEARLTYFASRGAQGDQLHKRVAQEMRQSYALAGGRFVSIRDTGISTNDAEPVFAKMIADYKAQNPRSAAEAVSVRREFDKWYVTDAAGLPVRGQPGFGMDQLRGVASEQERKRIAVASGEADMKAKGYIEGGDGNVYWQHTDSGLWHKRKRNGWLWERTGGPPAATQPKQGAEQ